MEALQGIDPALATPWGIMLAVLVLASVGVWRLVASKQSRQKDLLDGAIKARAKLTNEMIDMIKSQSEANHAQADAGRAQATAMDQMTKALKEQTAQLTQLMWQVSAAIEDHSKQSAERDQVLAEGMAKLCELIAGGQSERT